MPGEILVVRGPGCPSQDTQASVPANFHPQKERQSPDLLSGSVETGNPNFSVTSTSFQMLAPNSECYFLNSWWVSTNQHGSPLAGELSL